MTSEAAVQAAVRAEYARRGYMLFRNNTGVLTNPETGRPVRFGLANDSSAVNARIKPGDLIGWDTVIVTYDMIGHPIARFTSIEVKPPGWKLRPGDERAQAQQRWIDLVVAAGGEARFVTGVD